jgi:hypothetical protein
MADPVVHLTNGVPDSGTGNITTLGALLPIAKTTQPSAGTDGNVVPALFDKLGKQVVVGSLREQKGAQVTVLTTTTAVAITPSVSAYVDIYGLILSNTSATAVEFTMNNGSTITSFMVPAGDTRGFMLPEGAAYPATATNTSWMGNLSVAVTSLKVTTLFVKNL